MAHIFSVEGNIGSGKSTLVKILKLHLGVQNIVFLEEPVSIWESITDKNGESIISKFYGDQEKYAFSFQMMAYISRVAMLKDCIKENPNSIILCERCVNTDRNVFAKMLYDDNKIEEVDYQIYLKWFDHFVQDIPISGYIYVKATPVTSHERVLKRARDGEVIPIEYLQKCHDYHENWLQHVESPMLTLNANQDYGFKRNDYHDWILMIVNFMKSIVEDIEVAGYVYVKEPQGGVVHGETKENETITADNKVLDVLEGDNCENKNSKISPKKFEDVKEISCYR